jgi:hypothetical protein
MMRRLFTVLVLAVTAASTGAKAGVSFYDGDDLYRLCSGGGGDPGYVVCLRYATGVADALGGDSIRGWKAYLPRGPSVTPTKVGEVVLRYLAAHPERRHNNQAAGLVAEALAEAFPCR